MSEIYEVTGIVVAIVGIVIPTWLTIRPQDITYKLILHESPVHSPIESKIALEVSHPDKPIKKCRVIYNGKELICDETKQNWATILAEEAALFRIPKGLEDENAKVIVKNHWHRLEKTTLNKIQREEPSKAWAKFIEL